MSKKRSGAAFSVSRAIYIGVAVLMSIISLMGVSLILFLAQSPGKTEYLKAMHAETGLLFATILYICCCLNIREDTWQGHTFTAASALLFVNILLSGICDVCFGTPGVAREYMIMLTITNVISTWICILFWHYQCISLPKNRRQRYFTAAIYSFAVLYVILLAVNLFTHFLYYVDADGYLHYPGESIDTLFMASFYVIYLLYILPQRSPWRKKLFIASFATFPLVGVVTTSVWCDIGVEETALTSIYILMLLAVYVVFFGDYVESQELVLRQKAKLTEQEREQTELRTALMLSQIRPHFLYNALTAIRNLCKRDPDEAYKALGSFADYLRANMEMLGSDRTVPFAKELEHIETYLMLEQLRFGDELKVEYDIRCRDFSLPALTVQPIVENAVRHGAVMNEKGGLVRICTERIGDRVRISVTDNGPGFDPAVPPADGRSHIGLSSVRNSLAANGCGELQIESSPGVGSTVTIFIKEERK